MTTVEEGLRLQKRRRWNRKYGVEENNFPEVYALYTEIAGPVDLSDCSANKLERLIDPMLREIVHGEDRETDQTRETVQATETGKE